MDVIKKTSVPSMRLSRRHGTSTLPSSPLFNPTEGSLHLTTHHIIFEREIHSNGAETGAVGTEAGRASGLARGGGEGQAEGDDKELWIPLSLLHSVTRAPPGLTGAPTPLILRTRDYYTYELHLATIAETDDVWDTLKGLCGSFSIGGLENRYAFFCDGSKAAQSDRKGKKKAGWEIYNPAEEFARMGVGSRSKAWRFTNINADFEFCPSYPAQIVVPTKISDTTLSYAVKYRSKSRIPGLVYLHWANFGSITRSSQPMVGITQNARSIQDEKLIEAIFSSHSQHSHPRESFTVAGPSSSSSSLDSQGGIVYGATATNVIIDARPTKNAYANSVKGAGTENMTFYKNCKKEYLGIDNIHVMRASLNGVFDALADAETTGRLDHGALRRTNWLSHLTNILDGVLIVVRTVHLSNSHVLVHCSDGWDRTSQLSALPQICLDPFYRTARGLAVLIEKDWIAYGHRFADRSGHLCNDRVDFVQKLGDDASTQQAFLASVTRQFASSSHAFKETCPVFQQFLDCIWQIQRQYPERFEWNEKLLRRLVWETYAGRSGSFLFNSEQERAALRARERTQSVWEEFFDVAEDAELELKAEYRNPSYDPTLDDPESKAMDADQGVLLFDPQDVKWWFELFGRSDDEMNWRPPVGDVAQERTVTEVKVVESAEDDPVLAPLTAQASNLALRTHSAEPSPLSSPTKLSAPMLPSTSRSPSPSATRLDVSSPQQLSETVASVQKLGWSAWKTVQKFGQEAAKQYKEAQARPTSTEPDEPSSASWGADGAGELGETSAPSWKSSAGRSSGAGMWSKISATNPWATSDSPPSSGFASTSPSASSSTLAGAPTYKPYQPRKSPSLPPTDPLGVAPMPRFPASSEPSRQPSSTLSVNPWETISRDDALPSPVTRSPAVQQWEQPAAAKVEEVNGAAGGGDPLGVGLP
ncbi:hypothetical protein JCM1840_002732 [Sporobolomyces johnsonii]